MTINEAKKQLRAIEMTLRSQDGEFRVNFLHGTEQTAYYTTDINDAVGTATRMKESFDAQENYLDSLHSKL